MPTLDKGGAERFLCDLLINLDRTNFDPLLILFKRGGEWLAELTAAGIPVIIFEKKARFDLSNFLKIFFALKKFQPQIVHTQLGGDTYGRLAAKVLGVPLIISTEQNVNPDEGLIANLVKKIGNHWSDRIIAISQAVKDDVIKRYKTPADKIVIINNGIMIDKFLRNKSREANSSKDRIGPTFGTIGRLTRQKGQSLLIEAWAKLKHNNSNCLIAGTGPLQDSLAIQIKESGLADRIKLVGLISDVPNFLSSLDAFILPSLWEGQGLVLAEAALAGLPIITSDADGIKESFNSENAWLFPTGDIEALASRIDSLTDSLRSSDTGRRIGLAQDTVKTKFDIRNIADQYESLYRNLLEKNRV